jgi:hypothetical protein
VPKSTPPLSRPPPQLASRAVHKSTWPNVAHTDDLIPPISFVERSASDDESVAVDEDQYISESDCRPTKRLRR